MNNRRALIVFAREPVLGKVKTRLARDLGEVPTLKLYEAFVKDILKIAGRVNADRFLYYHGRPGFVPFLARAAGRVFTLRRQTGGDLGVRMERAFAFAFRQGYKSCILIGSDCLTLAPEMIERAFGFLKKNDCILGPSRDGGYYLIGLKEPEKQIFTGMPWSTNEILGLTERRLAAVGKTCRKLLQLEDIDSSENLSRFKININKYPLITYTRAACKIINNI